MLAGLLASGRVTGYIRGPLLTKDYFQRISYNDWAKTSEHTRTQHKSQELQTVLTLQCGLKPCHTVVDQSKQSKTHLGEKYTINKMKGPKSSSLSLKKITEHDKPRVLCLCLLVSSNELMCAFFWNCDDLHM